jgi:hypothetical protein
MPFIKRVSINIDDRIKIYNIYLKYFSQYNPNQCLNIVKKGKLVEYSIADNNIKIVKKIGSESRYGAVYLSKGSNVGELFRFASKIMIKDRYNILEIEILEKVSNLVINKRNPHFPLMYYNFTCNVLNRNPKLPKFAKNKEYIVNLNELANGDLKMYMHTHYNNTKLVSNALAQVYLAILSFHSIGYAHNDAHWGNFLYHKITPGGYIKYNINGREIYLENLGYLWVIWDFGFSDVFYTDTLEDCLKDYYRVLSAFMNERGKPNTGGFLPIQYPITDDIAKLVIFIRTIFESYHKLAKSYATAPSFDNIIFQLFFDRTNLYIKKADLPVNARVINNDAYVINI